MATKEKVTRNTVKADAVTFNSALGELQKLASAISENSALLKSNLKKDEKSAKEVKKFKVNKFPLIFVILNTFLFNEQFFFV